MDDILDGLEELSEEEFPLDDEEPLTDDVVEGSWDDEAGEDLSPYEMDEAEAQEITEAIRASTTATYILLARAHEHKAYKALGYNTWADYVKEEFEISAQRSYQLLDLSKAINLIEEATPEGTKVKLTEAQARDIKRELPHITEQLKENTSSMSQEEAEEEVARLVDEAREQRRAEEREASRRDQDNDELEEQLKSDNLEAQADAFLEAAPEGGVGAEADDSLISLEVAGNDSMPDLTPEDSMNLYNFFNVLTSITSLPEPDEFISVVPEARAEEINEQLLEATAWLNRFQTLWELREE